MHHLHNPSPAKAVNRNFFLLVASIRAFFFFFSFLTLKSGGGLL